MEELDKSVQAILQLDKDVQKVIDACRNIQTLLKELEEKHAEIWKK